MHVSSLPSPGFDSIPIGPITLTLYGLVIGIGVIAAVWLTGRRLDAQGLPADAAASLASWIIPAGLVGARLAHVATDWHRFEGQWLDVVKLWEGGLGILGGVIAGTAAGVWRAHQINLPIRITLDAAAPAVPLGQAIGRWGNWFNQELFGETTSLPWGLEIDEAHLPAGYEVGTLFHPTVLYESLWSLVTVAFVLWLGANEKLRVGHLFLAYLATYSVGRLGIETLRIDAATEVFGARINIWIYLAVLILSAASVRRREPTPHDQPALVG